MFKLHKGIHKNRAKRETETEIIFCYSSFHPYIIRKFTVIPQYNEHICTISLENIFFFIF